MKLVIHYDLINEILNVNKGFTPMKIVRNNKKSLAIFSVSFFFVDYIVTHSIPRSFLIMTFQDLGLFTAHYYTKKIDGVDIYKEISVINLQELAIKLKNELYINTNYDLLLKSNLYDRNYKINLNRDNIGLLENKYILVPSYDFNGNIKNTSILQEHVVGSNDYVLSIGSPLKKLKLARASL